MPLLDLHVLESTAELYKQYYLSYRLHAEMTTST